MSVRWGNVLDLKYARCDGPCPSFIVQCSNEEPFKYLRSVVKRGGNLSLPSTRISIARHPNFDYCYRRHSRGIYIIMRGAVRNRMQTPQCFVHHGGYRWKRRRKRGRERVAWCLAQQVQAMRYASASASALPSRQGFITLLQ
jgi:hypothetical protein